MPTSVTMSHETIGPKLVPTRTLDQGWVELGPTNVETAPTRPPTGEVIASIAHLSDLHICDSESPARQEYLDRHGYPDQPYADVLGVIGTYRPQEALTVPVAIAMIEAVNSMADRPRSRRPLDAVVLTGDLTDNAQHNELNWVVDLLNGGTVAQASGGPSSSWVGSPHATFSDWYWHPDGHPAGTDRWRQRHGFPRIDGLVDAARAPFRSPGLNRRFFGVHGNHDLLLQGTVAPDESLVALATGERRVIDLAPGQSTLTVLENVPGVGPARYTHTGLNPTEPVPADPARRFVDPGDFRRAQGQVDRVGPDHSFSTSLTTEVRLIGLDTVNPHGGWEGSVSRRQLDWVNDQIEAAAEPYVIVASHHPSWRLVNGYRPDGHPPRVLVSDVIESLLAQSKVIAWLSGHVHRHAVTMHRGLGGRALPEFTAASLIDWPQQSRLLEIERRPDRTLVLTSLAFDHAGPAQAKTDLADPLQLSAISRTLARNAPGLRERVNRADAEGSTTRWSPHNAIVEIADPNA